MEICAELLKMSDEITKGMAMLRHLSAVFEKCGGHLSYNPDSMTYKIEVGQDTIPLGVMADIEWLKRGKHDYRMFEAMFKNDDVKVTTYSTWGSPYQDKDRIGIWGKADKDDVDFSLVFFENKEYPIAHWYNPDKCGDSPNEAWIRDEYGVVHHVLRA